MYDIEDFSKYTNQSLEEETAILVWSERVGYQFIKYSGYNGQTIVGVRV